MRKYLVCNDFLRANYLNTHTSFFIDTLLFFCFMFKLWRVRRALLREEII